MKVKHLILLLTTVFITNEGNSQITNQSILQDIKNDIQTADRNAKQLVTNTGFNVFLQKKAINYLTGVSDLSLAKFYASYSTDDDKLNLGFNIPAFNPYTKRLSFIINPIFESDVKNNFSTLFSNNPRLIF
jgi:hypothetical protein